MAGARAEGGGGGREDHSDQLNDNVQGSDKATVHSNISVLYSNVHSVVNKIDELRCNVSDNKPDVISICETWTNNDISNAFLSIDGYNIICRHDRKDTNNGIGGGLLVYVKSDLKAREITDKNIEDFNQCCLINVKSENDKSVNLALMYRPHNLYDNSDIDLNNDKLCSVLKSIPKPFIIVGDFNYSDIDWVNNTSSAKSRQFLDTVNDQFISQHIDFSTHVSGTMPDLVLASSENLILDIENNGTIGSSDHTSILVNINSKPVIKCEKIGKKDWRKADYDKIKDDVNNVCWSAMFQDKDAEECWIILRDQLHKSTEDHVPVQRPRKPGKPPWMNQQVLRIIRRKKRCWKRYSMHKDNTSHQEYKKAEKFAKNAVRNAKKKFEKSLAKEAKSNPKAFYKYINSKKSNRESIGPLKVNSTLIDTDKDMAETLNNFFQSVFTKENTDELPELSDIKEGIPLLENIVFSEKDIKEKLLKLNPFSAPGPDNINPSLLVNIAEEVAVPLNIIFNKSMSTGTVPSDWKKANVTPIFKKGSKYNPGNYRPVSLTSVLCKVMEGLIKEKVVDHLDDNELIFQTQHGFMPRKSCLTNLLDFLEKLSLQVDLGKAVDVLYLDFAKAFDKVPHCRLRKIMEAHGISGQVLHWIQNWLTGREQCVVLNGEVSDNQPVTSGVPQGSVLGPILFVIFINPLDLVIKEIVEILSKFADDTKTAMIVQDEEDAKQFQKLIDKLVKWAEDWQMEFNASKCKIMHVGRGNKKFNYTMGGYAPAGTILAKVEEEKDVGVIVASNLKPSKQCSTAARKANVIVGQMARAFSYRDKKTWIKIYTVYVRPVLEYSVQAWSPWLQADIDALEDIQKRVIRMTSGLKSDNYEDKLKEVGLSTLKQRRMRGDMIQTWKILHGHDNVDEKTWFVRAAETAARTTRQSDSRFNIVGSRANTDLRKNTFSIRVVNKWNSLPEELKSVSTLVAFKNMFDKLNIM